MAVFTAAAGTSFNSDNFGTFPLSIDESTNFSQQIESSLSWVDTNKNSFRIFQTLFYDNNSDGILTPSAGDYLMGRVDYDVILPAPVIPAGQTEATQHYSGTTTAYFRDPTNIVIGTLTLAHYDLDITATNANGPTNYFASYVNPAYAMFSGDDTVTLGNLDDFFYDPDGSLLIDLGGGDDTLFAMQSGADTIYGGSGNDVIGFYNSNHLIFGGDGDDVVSDFGTSENDQVGTTLTGGAGNDSLQGSFGDDLFIEGAGSGDDVLDGGSGSDTVDYSGALSGVRVFLEVFSPEQAPAFYTGIARGGSGTDYLIYVDHVTGSQFGDVLRGDEGDNILTGLGGADTLQGGYGADHLDGGAGRDMARYNDDFSSITVNLTTGFGTSGQANGDVLAGIEDVMGGYGWDQLIGNKRANLLDGGAGGDDVLTGLGGNDSLLGHGGADLLSGGNDNDTLIGGTQGDSLHGDTLRGGLGDDHFVFVTEQDSPTFSGDVITDFGQLDGNHDIIDISALHTMPLVGGRELPFVLTGNHGHGRFTQTAGEVRLVEGARNTVVQIDLDGDGLRDMEILVKNMLTLTGHDFIL